MEKYFNKMAEQMDLIGLTIATQESYLRRCRTFVDFLNKPAEKIEMSDIREYVKHLKYSKNLSIGTINAYISGIKAFYEYGLNKEWNPRIVPRMKGYVSMPVVLAKEEVLEILSSIQNIKHKAIISLLYGAGLRVNEAVRLRISDIDSKNMQIFIGKSKNRHDRYAILPEFCLNILREYWKSSSPRPVDWLFPGRNLGEHLNVKTIKNVMLEIKNILKIQKKVSAHTLRHSFATHLLEDNCPLPFIQQMMGHRSIKTTSKYIHLTSKAKMNIKSPLDVLMEDK